MLPGKGDSAAEDIKTTSAPQFTAFSRCAQRAPQAAEWQTAVTAVVVSVHQPAVKLQLAWGCQHPLLSGRRGRLLQNWGIGRNASLCSPVNGWRGPWCTWQSPESRHMVEARSELLYGAWVGSGSKWESGICSLVGNLPFFLSTVCPNDTGQLLPWRTSDLGQDQPLTAGSSSCVGITLQRCNFALSWMCPVGWSPAV